MLIKIKQYTEVLNMSSQEFMVYMLEQSGNRRFTDKQLSKAMKAHNETPTTHLLIQLAVVGTEENVFTEEEKKMLLPSYS
jgi:hypothetical protein